MQKTHGMSRTRIYSTWKEMRRRCSNPNHSDWEFYGGRGITVCAEWDSFEQFHADMGDRPPGKSLERIDNSKGYSPDNCKWATHTEQVINRRRFKNNSTGITGVGYRRRSNKFRARITIGKTLIELGETENFFEACCLRKSAEKQFKQTRI